MSRKESVNRNTARELCNCAAIYEEGGYSERQLKTITRLAENGISDSEWNTLKRDHRLPDAGRSGIDNVIISYWDWRIDIEISKKLPSKIGTAVQQTERLRQTLSTLQNDRDFFKGIHAYYRESPSEQYAFFDQILEELGKLGRLLDDAQTRTKRPAHRPSHRAVWFGLRLLQNFLELLGRDLEDGPKSIAYPVLFLADPKVTKRMIRGPLKEFVATRPVWEWTGIWVEDHLQGRG